MHDADGESYTLSSFIYSVTFLLSLPNHYVLQLLLDSKSKHCSLNAKLSCRSMKPGAWKSASAKSLNLMPIATISFNSHNIKDKSIDYATVTANRMVPSHSVDTSGQ